MSAVEAIRTAESNLAAQLRAAAALLDTVGTSELAAASAELERAARDAKERLREAAKGAAVLLANVAGVAEALAVELAEALQPTPAEAAKSCHVPPPPLPGQREPGASGEEAERPGGEKLPLEAPVNRVAEHLPADDDGIIFTPDGEKAMQAELAAPAAAAEPPPNGRPKRSRKR